MMFKNIVLSLSVLVAFTACGGGSGSGNENEDANITDPQVETATGYYIDSAVSGISYTCGSKAGVTGDDGSFTFELGKGCRFYLNQMTLRNVESDGLYDNIKIIENNITVARLLQTLDDDANPDNGISINASVVQAMNEGGITTLPQNDQELQAIYDAIQNVQGYGGTVKTITETTEHLNKTQNSQIKELMAGKTFYVVYRTYNNCNELGCFHNIVTLEELSFNQDMTSANSTIIEGFNKGEHSITEVSLEDEKLIFYPSDYPDNFYLVLKSTTSNYILFDDYEYTAQGGSDFVYSVIFYTNRSEADNEYNSNVN